MKFSADKKDKVWQKGKQITGINPDNYRHDICSNVMKYTEYGNTNSKYGWEIDHIIPVSKLGMDSLSNLQPLQWENNRKKGDARDCNGHSIHSGSHSYITSIRWDLFLNSIDVCIDNAVEIYKNRDQYIIKKSLEK